MKETQNKISELIKKLNSEKLYQNQAAKVLAEIQMLTKKLKGL